MKKVIKGYRRFYESTNDDPNLQKGSLDYKGGNIVQFLENLGSDEVNLILDNLLGSDDPDERMELAEEILQYINDNYIEIYDQVEDDIKDLALS